MILSAFLHLWESMGCSPPGSSFHGDSLGKNTGVGCHFLLQGISPTQRLNPGFLHCRWILYHLSHQGSPWHNSKKWNSRAIGSLTKKIMEGDAKGSPSEITVSPGGWECYAQTQGYTQSGIIRVGHGTDVWMSSEPHSHQQCEGHIDARVKAQCLSDDAVNDNFLWSRGTSSLSQA